jgi:hypothetical protein
LIRHVDRQLRRQPRVPGGETAAQALEEGNLQLLTDPERPFDPGHGVQLTKQLLTAWIISAKSENDQPHYRTGRKSKHQQGDSEHRPGDNMQEHGNHQACPLAVRGDMSGPNLASCRDSAITAPRAALPLSVSS